MGTDKRKSLSEQLQPVGVQIRTDKLNTEIAKVTKAEVACSMPHRQLPRGEKCACGFRNTKV